jgi:hypothetical protein
LDYGGYSLNRIYSHQNEIWPEGVKEQINQFQIDFESKIDNSEILDDQNEFLMIKETKIEKITDELIFTEYLDIDEKEKKNIKKKKNKDNEKKRKQQIVELKEKNCKKLN